MIANEKALKTILSLVLDEYRVNERMSEAWLISDFSPVYYYFL